MQLDASPSIGTIRPGQIIRGKYWVDRVLGRGGMGTVVLATHLQLGHHVALKCLRPSVARDQTNFRRFMREARATAQLRGEHIVRVLDVGSTEDNVPFIVMEYMPGRDLEEVVASGPVGSVTAVDYVLQAATAIAEAHAMGIVHRDLKPSNIFLSKRPDGRELIKVMDFGVAKWTAEAQGNLTSSHVILGSPGYMAPEQLRNARTVDGRADLWSLGAVLFELLAGYRPYDARTLPQMIAAVLDEAPRALPDQVPPELAQIVIRCLARDPADRYSSVQELVTALAPFGSPAVADATRRVVASAGRRTALRLPLFAAPTLNASSGSTAIPVPRTPRRAAALIGGLTAIVLVLFLAVAVRHATRGTTRPAPQPATTAPPPQASGAPTTTTVDVIPLAAEPTTVLVEERRPSTSPPVTRPARTRPRPRRKRPASTNEQPAIDARLAPGEHPRDRPVISGDLDGDGIPDVR